MLALIAFVELDVTLTAIAVGISLGRRPVAATLAVTALLAGATVAVVGLAWNVWMVAPACVGELDPVGCIGRQLAADIGMLAFEILLAQWFWMLAVALAARFFAATTRTRPTAS